MSEAIEIDYEWPEGVPETYDELVRDYGDFVAKRVARYNKVDRNLEDLIQDIWTKLIHGDVLKKYVERASQTLPPTMTAVEMCSYLGITFKDFADAQRRYHGKKKSTKPTPVHLPEPLNGVEAWSDQAVYDRASVEDIDNMLSHEGGQAIAVRTQPRVLPVVGAQGFRAYLTQAIHNHFANWCRHRSRKYKDVLLAQNAVITPVGDAGYAQRGHSEDGIAWEQAIVSASLDAEELSQYSEFISTRVQPLADRYSIDMSKVSEWETYTDENGIKRQRPTPEAQQALEILDYISQGYTIREALKTQQRAEARRVKISPSA